MEKKTVQYKRTIKGSVGAGVGSLLGAKGRRFYILEHKEASKYHKAGESQKIIIDQVEIGRAAACQVRFDESFSTVSRRHAAIVKDGNGWKLVQLSATNTTLLNGRPVETEWFLQNGDEIQLSLGGPKLGFIVPVGKQSLVSSIKMTERLELFRKQALRPYKKAIVAMMMVVILLSGAGSYVLMKQADSIDRLFVEYSGAKVWMEQITKDSEKKEKVRDSIERENKVHYQRLANQSGQLIKDMRSIKGLAGFVDAAKPYVYAVITTVEVQLPNGKTARSQSQGTGFLLSDGRFVTARHCVQPWMYDLELMQCYALSQSFPDVKMKVSIQAVSMKDQFSLTPSQFRLDSSHDVQFQFPMELSEGTTLDLTGCLAVPIKDNEGNVHGNQAMYGSDWAYARVGHSGGLVAAPSLASSLKAGTEVHVLGFPAGLGIADGKTIVEPIYNKMTVSREGLNSARCVMVSEGVAHGNSGGPVFAVQDGKLVVIGIVSRKEGATQQQGMFGITQQQQQYDQLVPISNMN